MTTTIELKAYSAFSEWLSERLGTRAWVVASRLTDAMRAKGYELAIPQARFTALRAEFLQSTR